MLAAVSHAGRALERAPRVRLAGARPPLRGKSLGSDGVFDMSRLAPTRGIGPDAAAPNRVQLA
jgi:hypothetical protein